MSSRSDSFSDYLLSDRTQRLVLRLLLIFYTVILLWGIVFKCNMNDQLNIERNLSLTLWERFTVNLIPFRDIYYSILGRRVWSILAFFFNVICFIPLGMLLRRITEEGAAVLLTLALSLCVEIFQLFSGFGGFDPTDLFLNALGGYLGSRLYDAILPRLSERMTAYCLAAAVVPTALLAIAVTVRTVILFPI